MKRRFRLLGKWSIPAWILIAYVGFSLLVDLLRRIDFIWAHRNDPWLITTWTWLASPTGLIVLFLVGVLWLTLLGFSSVHDDAQDANVSATSSISSETVQTNLIAQPSFTPTLPPQTERAPASDSSEPQPNVVVLDTDIVPMEVDSHGLFTVSTRDPNALAAVVTFRNDVLPGRRTGAMNYTRAHLTIHPKGGKKLNVHSGYWLNEEYNTPDISPGQSPQLILAVTSPQVGRIVVPDDRREDASHYEGPIGVGFDEPEATIHVKLVGGFEAQHVKEFDFAVRREPEFSVTHIRG